MAAATAVMRGVHPGRFVIVPGYDLTNDEDRHALRDDYERLHRRCHIRVAHASRLVYYEFDPSDSNPYNSGGIGNNRAGTFQLALYWLLYHDHPDDEIRKKATISLRNAKAQADWLLLAPNKWDNAHRQRQEGCFLVAACMEASGLFNAAEVNSVLSVGLLALLQIEKVKLWPDGPQDTDISDDMVGGTFRPDFRTLAGAAQTDCAYQILVDAGMDPVKRGDGSKLEPGTVHAKLRQFLPLWFDLEGKFGKSRGWVRLGEWNPIEDGVDVCPYLPSSDPWGIVSHTTGFMWTSVGPRSLAMVDLYTELPRATRILLRRAARALATWGLLACFDPSTGENVVAIDPKKPSTKEKYGSRVGYVGPLEKQGGLMKLPFSAWPEDLAEAAGENGYHSHMIAIESAFADVKTRTQVMTTWARSARAFTYPGEVDEQTIIVLGNRRAAQRESKEAASVLATAAG